MNSEQIFLPPLSNGASGAAVESLEATRSYAECAGYSRRRKRPPDIKRSLREELEWKARCALARCVVGQEAVCRLLVALGLQHRFEPRVVPGGRSLRPADRAVMLIGGIGLGKTLIPSTILQVLEIPFVILDATTFMPPGMKNGRTHEEIFEILRAASVCSPGGAERGVVIIENLDHLNRGPSQHVPTPVRAG
jgi:ATP-dependent protease Clp ATPase subunit